jgi:hypothetical protein
MGEFEAKWQETESNLQSGAWQESCLVLDMQRLWLVSDQVAETTRIQHRHRHSSARHASQHNSKPQANTVVCTCGSSF